MIAILDKAQKFFDRKWLFWVLLAALGISCALFLTWITPKGMGLVNDSVQYISGANNMLAGHGYSRIKGDGSYSPITNFPPMYSITLAALGFLGMGGLQSTEFLNVLLFGVNAVLMALLVRKVTGKGFFGLIAGALLALNQSFFSAHTFAMSDPLYYFLSFLVLGFLIYYFKTRRWGWIAAAGLTSSLAFLTRYVGVSLYGTTLLCLLFFSSEKNDGKIIWRRFWRDFGIFMLAGMPLVLAWSIRNFLVSSNATNRTILYHPVRPEVLLEGVSNFWNWLLPQAFSPLIETHTAGFKLALFVFLAGWAAAALAALLRYFKNQVKSEISAFQAGWFFAAEGIVYLAVVVFTLTFLDASPIFENRILMPFYISLLALFAWLLSLLWEHKSWLLRLGSLVLAFLVLVSFVEESRPAVWELRQDGQSFASSQWAESRTVAAVRELPQDATLYSNKITAIYFFTDRPAFIIPSPTNPATQLPREGYQEELDEIHQEVLDGEGYMIVFGFRSLELNPEDAGMMADISEGMPVYGEYEDGIIFGLPAQP